MHCVQFRGTRSTRTSLSLSLSLSLTGRHSYNCNYNKTNQDLKNPHDDNCFLINHNRIIQWELEWEQYTVDSFYCVCDFRIYFNHKHQMTMLTMSARMRQWADQPRRMHVKEWQSILDKLPVQWCSITTWPRDLIPRSKRSYPGIQLAFVSSYYMSKEPCWH